MSTKALAQIEFPWGTPHTRRPRRLRHRPIAAATVTARQLVLVLVPPSMDVAVRHGELVLRKARIRARSLTPRRLRRMKEAPLAPDVAAQLEAERPHVRGDCLPGGKNEMRPCPFVSCRYHLWADVGTEKGSIKLNFPHIEVERLTEMVHTCALDVADGGETPVEDLSALMNLGVERVRQVTAIAIQEMKRAHVQGEVLVQIKRTAHLKRESRAA